MQRVRLFIENFPSANGIPLPGRVANHQDKVMILPSDVTKQFLYDKYRSLSLSAGLVAIGRSKFYAIWQENLPHISITEPSSDLCFTCQKKTMALQKTAHLSDDERAELLQTAQEHLRRAETERDYYNTQVEAAVTSNEVSSS